MDKTFFKQDDLTFMYITEADIQNITKMLAKESVCERVYFGPNTEEDTKAYFMPLVTSIQTALTKAERPAEHVFSIWKERLFIGQTALLPVSFSPGNYNFGLTIDDTYWRQGIGEKTCRFMVDFAFHKLNAHRISSDCMKENIGSRRTMEKCGFRLEGTQKRYWHKNGKFYDNLLFGLLKDQPE
ncbi:MAG: GNAT family N-acetyltransferase [Thermoguttaceae bacterium]